MRFDPEGLEFPVVGIPRSGFTASKTVRSWGFWGLRHQIWGFTGFNANLAEDCEKRRKTAEIRGNPRKKPEKPNFDELG